ncbi:Os02g0516901, partial [Oryza sativa Japonica Group]
KKVKGQLTGYRQGDHRSRRRLCRRSDGGGGRRRRLVVVLLLLVVGEQRLFRGGAATVEHRLLGSGSRLPRLLLLLHLHLHLRRRARGLLFPRRGITSSGGGDEGAAPPAVEYVVHLPVEEPREPALPPRVVPHGPERRLPRRRRRRRRALPLLDLLVVPGEVAPPLPALHGAPLHAVPPAVLRHRRPLGLQRRHRRLPPRAPRRRRRSSSSRRRGAAPPAAPAPSALHHALPLDQHQYLLPRPPRQPRRAAGRRGGCRGRGRRGGVAGGGHARRVCLSFFFFVAEVDVTA